MTVKGTGKGDVINSSPELEAAKSLVEKTMVSLLKDKILEEIQSGKLPELESKTLSENFDLD